MNTHVATANAIDWKKVLRITLRFAWAVAVLAFKLLLIALSFIVGLLTAGGDNDHQRDADERRQRDDDDYQFMLDSEYRKRRH